MPPNPDSFSSFLSWGILPRLSCPWISWGQDSIQSSIPIKLLYLSSFTRFAACPWCPSVATLSADVTSACCNGLRPTSWARLFLFLEEVEHACAANHSCSASLTGQAQTGSEPHFSLAQPVLFCRNPLTRCLFGMVRRRRLTSRGSRDRNYFGWGQGVKQKPRKRTQQDQFCMTLRLDILVGGHFL